MEHYHNVKTIKPNVLIARFIRKSDGFKIDHVKFQPRKMVTKKITPF